MYFSPSEVHGSNILLYLETKGNTTFNQSGALSKFLLENKFHSKLKTKNKIIVLILFKKQKNFSTFKASLFFFLRR